MRIFRVDGTFEYRRPNGEPSLEELQKLVGGYIDIINCYTENGEPAHMIVDEEGLLKQKPINMVGTIVYVVMAIRNGFTYDQWQPIVGDVVLLEGEELLI